MNKKWIALIAVLIALVIGGIVWLTGGFSAPPEPVDEPVPTLGLENEEEESGHANGAEELGKGANHPAIDGTIAGDGEPTEMGVVPENLLASSQGLADAWMSYDSKQMGETRKNQLAKVIPNAEDWADVIPDVHWSRGDATGNPTWRSVSKATGPATLIPDFSYEAGGKYFVAAQISFHTDFSSGGGNKRGSVYGEPVWSFVFDADGNLLDVVEPAIPD